MNKKMLRFLSLVTSLLLIFQPVTALAVEMKSDAFAITDLNFGTAFNLLLNQDSAPPVIISGPNLTELEPRKATIEWLTDKKSSSGVNYGISTNYDQENGTGSQTVTHKVTLFGLDPETTYHYKVVSIDPLNAKGESADKTFTTPADAGINTIKVSDVSYTQALVTWKTGNATVSKLEYGTSQSYGQTKTTSSNAFTSDHTVLLDGLIPGTEYHFRINAENDKKSTLRSSDQTFTTIAEPKFLSVTPVALNVNEVSLSWETNTPTTALVKYKAKSGPNLEELTTGVAELATKHSLKLKNLVGNTVYGVSIIATDGQGKQVNSGEKTFGTPLDKEPPIISDLKVTVARSGDELVLTASWKTNEPATGEIVFGPKTKLDQTVSVPGSQNYTTDHTVVATGVSSATAYGLTAFSADAAENRGKADISFVSPKLSKTIIQLLVDSFLSRFGWLLTAFSR